MTRYAQRRAKGLCGWYGCPNKSGRRSMCPYHLAAQRANQIKNNSTARDAKCKRDHYHRKVAKLAEADTCYRCGEQGLVTETYCERCRDEYRAAQRARHAARRTSTRKYLCGVCGKQGHNRMSCPDKIKSEIDPAEYAYARMSSWPEPPDPFATS